MAEGYDALQNILSDPDAIQSSDRSKVGLLDLLSPSESIATLQCSWSVIFKWHAQCRAQSLVSGC